MIGLLGLGAKPLSGGLILLVSPCWASHFCQSPVAGPEKSNQKRLPLHPALRCAQGSFAPPLLQGPAYKGHPWSFKRGRLVLSPHPCGSLPYATVPLTLLKGAVGVACGFVQKSHAKDTSRSFKRLGLRSPSVGRVEVLRRGTRGMDAERGAKGQGCPFVTAPGATPERGKSGRRPDPDVGVAFSLVTFSWPDKSNEAKRSNSRRLARRASVASQVTRPGGRNQMCRHAR